MNILVVSPFVPHLASGHGGGRVVHELIRELARRHEVGLLTFVESDAEQELARDLAPDLHELETVRHDVKHIPKLRRLANLPTLTPSMALHVRHPDFAAAIGRMTEGGRYDIVQLTYPWMAFYLDDLRGGAPVIDLIECFGRHWRGRMAREGMGAARPYFAWDWWRMERFERRALARMRRVFVLTDEEREWLLARDPRLPVRTRLVGVDLAPLPVGDDAPERGGLLFVGSFRHPANVEGLNWFLDEVFPLVREREPELRLRVAGAPAPTEWADRPGVDVLGFVDDLEPLYARTLACVSPIRYGGGVKTKGLEAMAHAVPLVTTRLGAEGYAARDREDLEIADDPREFADRIVGLVRDPAHARRIGAAGRRLVEFRHSWDVVLDELEDEYRALLSEG